jgi:hypothetical protein
MKKIFLLIAILAYFGVSLHAQDTMYVHQKGGILTKFSVDKIDSILFKTSDISTGRTIKGYAQKGPFINGSSITVFDLHANLVPSGRSFSGQIIDNKGSFELNNIELSSNDVSIRTDGFYFNEVLGKQSNSQITLYALADISNKSNININLLTHLEKSRIEYLIKAGKSFSEAKAQAQKEILAIFNIERNNIQASECLNIIEQGEDNAILLAISTILQGLRTESEMTELLSNISTDIKTDGILNNSALGSALINQAVALDTVDIKNNLIKRYNEIGATTSVPFFGKYIANFIKNTPFEITQSLITYPEKGLYGDNILSLTQTNYKASTGGILNNLSMNVHLLRGSALKIQITSLDYDTIYYLPPDPIVGSPGAVYLSGKWGYTMGTGSNWLIDNFDINKMTQIFTALESDKTCDLQISFERGTYLIEYFEMNATEPTRKKTIYCNP